LDNYRGLIKRHPTIAIAMTVMLISLAGIPPTAGFIAKFMVFGAAIETGWVWLAIVAILTSVVSVFMYARILRAMFFRRRPARRRRRSRGYGRLVVG
jgi:NADH-quinone oxidoreductase subunit N